MLIGAFGAFGEQRRRTIGPLFKVYRGGDEPEGYVDVSDRQRQRQRQRINGTRTDITFNTIRFRMIKYCTRLVKPIVYSFTFFNGIRADGIGDFVMNRKVIPYIWSYMYADCRTRAKAEGIEK